MNIKNIPTRVAGDVAAVLLFVLISFLYFQKPVERHLVLDGVDNNAALGSNHEMEEYLQTHGERTRWTNTLFSGMPTYQMAPAYPSTKALSQIEKAYRLWLPNVVAYVFIMLLGFYIMLRAFNFRVWMAALGAVLWAFSSYYFIIIAAGHIWKLLTLSYIPPTIGGMVLCYRGKYLWGAALTALFTALQVLSNHVQMTYYFLFLIAFMMLGFLLQAWKEGKTLRWVKASAVFGVASLLGVATNVSNLFHTWQYSKETMRSKSELTSATKDEANQTKDGLERDYITAWSYGGDELMTLMIPDAKGGYSAPLSMNHAVMEQADMELADAGVYNVFTQYHGEQPMTSGPVYVGAIVVFLFLLGLFLVRGPMVWCLLAATVLTVLLSLGRNLMPLTDFFLDHMPMYDKFRTPASILVVAEFTMPLIALLGLRKLYEQPTLLRSRTTLRLPGKTLQLSNMLFFWAALALTAGVCLLMYLMPELMGTFTSTRDVQTLLSNQIPADSDFGRRILSSIALLRQNMFQADALRSFWFIMAAAATLYACTRWMSAKPEGKARLTPAITTTAILLALCLADMWNVNRRYLNDSNFRRPEEVAQIQPTPADLLILQDTDPYYRVVNTTVSTFNDNTTSYFHFNIGGYHAAKLRRYQELIEAHLAPELTQLSQAEIGIDSLHPDMLSALSTDRLWPALNMLNMRYIILPGNHVLRNTPNGNAWFVDELQYVDNADQELAAIGTLNTRHQAVADRQFQHTLGTASPDSTAQATLTTYQANELTYEAQSEQGGILVFSDIYYPGWTATVDGQPTDIGRVNYVLRAIRLQPGKHQVQLSFHPQTIRTTETIATTALILLATLFALAIAWSALKRKREEAKR